MMHSLKSHSKYLIMKRLIITLTNTAILVIFTMGFSQAQTPPSSYAMNQEVLTSGNEASDLSAESGIKYFENTEKNHVLNIESTENGKLVIQDENLKVLYRQPIQKGVNEVKLNSLDQGSYIIKIVDEKGKTTRKRLNYVRLD